MVIPASDVTVELPPIEKPSAPKVPFVVAPTVETLPCRLTTTLPPNEAPITPLPPMPPPSARLELMIPASILTPPAPASASAPMPPEFAVF